MARGKAVGKPVRTVTASRHKTVHEQYSTSPLSKVTQAREEVSFDEWCAFKATQLVRRVMNKN